MAKTRQLVVRMDEDIAEAIQASADTYKRSRAVIVAAALDHFTKLSPMKKRAVIVAYATRDIPRGDRT